MWWRCLVGVRDAHSPLGAVALDLPWSSSLLLPRQHNTTATGEKERGVRTTNDITKNQLNLAINLPIEGVEFSPYIGRAPSSPPSIATKWSAPESSPSSSSNSAQSPPPPSKSPPPPSPSTPRTSKEPSTKSPKSSTESPNHPKLTKSSAKKSGGSNGKEKAFPSGDPMVAVVVGVVIGVVGFALFMAVVACLCCARKKKKRAPPMNMPFYTDEKGNVYFPNARMLPGQWQQYPSNNSHAAPPPVWHPHGGPLSPPPAPLSSDMGPYSSGPLGPSLPPPSPNVALGFSKSSFTYEELAAATSGFSSSNLLGQGGFGYVYKGVLAGSGKLVAVKQLKSGSGQGEREFQAEVEIISRVHHRHLVSLVGYCIAGHQRLLVYEFVPNNTLEHHLHGRGIPVMGWPARHRIALGSAKGLAYLHEDCHPRIIHRDIKAANILLDANFEAMVADFGLAKLTTDNNTHVSTRVMGTFGYLAPEYASSGKLTDKSDIFSFGVMLLELITGRRPIDNSNYTEDSLVDWARPMLDSVLSGEAGYEELVDERLEGVYNRVEVERMAASAAASIRLAARRRPKMSQIVRALEGGVLSLEDLHEGSMNPGQNMLLSSGSDSVSNFAPHRQLAYDSDDFTDDGSDYSTETASTRRK